MPRNFDFLKRLPSDEKHYILEMLADEIIEEEKQDLPVDIIRVDNRQKEALSILQNAGKLVGFSTGINQLDNILGGMDVEDLIIIGGQAGHGKSLLMQKIALAVASAGNPILYVSLEMSIPQQIARFYTMGKTKWDNNVVTEISKMPIYFYNGKESMTLGILDKALEGATKDFGVKMCFIDHLHYFSHSTDNVASEIGMIIRTIKGYARKYAMPIVVISTLRKLNTGGSPDINDLKDSVMIGYDADLIIMIWRDIDGENKPANHLTIRVRKNRPRGRIGGFVMEITDNYDLIELKDATEQNVRSTLRVEK